MEHELLIVTWVNRILDPVLAPVLGAAGIHAAPGQDLIPAHLVMGLLILLAWTVFSLLLKSRLSVEHPSRVQIVMEDLVSALVGLLDDWIGPRGRSFLPIVGALGAFILIGNYMGLIPGLMSPTSNMSVTAGCAVTIWVYYHVQGIRAQGIVSYLKHFAVPPGAPVWMAPLMIIIEPISHVSRMLSLTLRLFGNIFGEEMIILVLASLFAWVLPLPIMVLSLITGGLQAFIFVLLSIIYLQGAVTIEHDEHHANEPGHSHLGHEEPMIASAGI